MPRITIGGMLGGMSGMPGMGEMGGMGGMMLSNPAFMENMIN